MLRVLPCTQVQQIPFRRGIHCPRVRPTRAARPTRLTCRASSANVTDLWSHGLADCGDDGCTTIVPSDAFVLVYHDGKANQTVSSHADVARALERGITISGDRQLLIGSGHAKHVNCILDHPAVAARHARLGMNSLSFATYSTNTNLTELVPGEWENPLGSTPQWWGQALLERLGLVSQQFGSRLYVTDLHSGRGTTVNGVPLVPCFPTELHRGDVVGFGGGMFFRVVQPTRRRHLLPWQRW